MIIRGLKKLMMVWLVAAFPVLSHSQISNLSFRHLTPDEGLTQVAIGSVLTDSKGFVWMTGLDGINRFDGIRCLSNEQIAGGISSFGDTRTIIEDADGNIWIGTTDGIIQYNYTANKFFKHNIKLNKGLRNNFFTVLSYDKAGNILIGTSVRQLVLYNHKTGAMLQFPVPSSPNDSELGLFSFLHGDNLYNDVHLVSHAGQAIIHIYTLANITDSKPVWKIRTISFFQHILPIAFMPDPNTLFFSGNGFMYKYNLATGAFTKSRDILFGGDDYLNYSMDGKGYLWVSSNDGIAVLDTARLSPIGSIQYNPDAPEGISSKNFGATVDKNGIVWVTAWGKGIDYASLNERKFKSFLTAKDAEKNGISNFVRGIAEGPDGNFYCATQSGVVILDKNLRYKRQLPGFDPSLQLPDIKIMGNSLLIASDNEKKGLYVYDLFTGKHRYINKFLQSGKWVNPDIYHINPITEEEGLVSSVSYGLFKVNIRTGKSSVSPVNLFTNGRESLVYTYISAKGHLYASFNLLGFAVFKDQGEVFQQAYESLSGLTVKHIIPAGNDKLWIATTEGLLLFDDNKLKVLRKYTTDDGLLNNVVYALITDKKNNLWFSTNKGLGYLDVSQNKIYNFTKDDGLQSNEFNAHTVLRAKDGRIIFGGVNGLSVINPDAIGYTPPVPILQMTALKADSVLNPFALPGNKIVLPPGTNSFETEWTALNYSNPFIHKIRYKLSSLDKNWQETGNPASIRYTGLVPGSYELEVMASNAKGEYSGVSKKIAIVVIAYWWQAAWFKWGMVLLFSVITWLLIRGYFRRRINKEKQKIVQQLLIQQERERIIADLHDDIGATLSSMSIYSELADNLWQEKPEEGRKLVNRVAATSRELMDRMGDIIWSMKPASGDRYSLEARLKNYCTELLSPKNIACTFSIDKELSVAGSHPEARKNILLIAKEALNNIAKYSGASEVVISFQKKNELAVLTVTDNGGGFETAQTGQGNGLANIHERCRQLGGTCRIQSQPGQGTTIECLLPVAIFGYKA